jgi:hypothetical protein
MIELKDRRNPEIYFFYFVIRCFLLIRKYIYSLTQRKVSPPVF